MPKVHWGKRFNLRSLISQNNGCKCTTQMYFLFRKFYQEYLRGCEWVQIKSDNNSDSEVAKVLWGVYLSPLLCRSFRISPLGSTWSHWEVCQIWLCLIWFTWFLAGRPNKNQEKRSVPLWRYAKTRLGTYRFPSMSSWEFLVHTKTAPEQAFFGSFWSLASYQRKLVASAFL